MKGLRKLFKIERGQITLQCVITQSTESSDYYQQMMTVLDEAEVPVICCQMVINISK